MWIISDSWHEYWFWFRTNNLDITDLTGLSQFCFDGIVQTLIFMCFSQEFLDSISSKLPVGQIANTPYAKLLSNLSKHTRVNSPKPVEQVDKRFVLVILWFLCCESPVVPAVSWHSLQDSSSVTHVGFVSILQVILSYLVALVAPGRWLVYKFSLCGLYPYCCKTRNQWHIRLFSSSESC